MDGVIPDSLKLPQSVPMAIKAYRRRFRSPATNVSEAGPDEQVHIYPDTATPGSFIDPASTYLAFDFAIQNSNFMVDYQNFGVEGVLGSILQTLRVYNQGSILEEISEYGTVASAMANLEGEYEQEVAFYMSNKLKDGYMGDCHKNFIKPPMCDSTGNIMHGLNPFGLGLITNSSANVNNSSTATSGANAQPFQDLQLTSAGQGNPLTVYGPRWSNLTTQTVAADTAMRLIEPTAWPDFYDPSNSEIVKKEFTLEFGSINRPQVMTNLVNVKCFPIGLKPVTDCFSTATYGKPNMALVSANGNTVGTASTPPTQQIAKIRVCAQFLSGILGRLAPKMLATMLLGPQQLFLALHLAPASIALNLSSDPCRRIAGTVRDYVRNSGWRNNSAPLAVTETVSTTIPISRRADDIVTVSSYAPGYGANSRVVGSTAFANAIQTFTKNICSGGYAIPTVEITSGGAETASIGANVITFSTAAVCKYYLPGDIISITTGPNVVLGAKMTNTTFNCLGTNIVASAYTHCAANLTSVDPVPQYALCKNAYLFKCTSSAGNTNNFLYANESQVFYGSKLPASVPQVKRILYFTTVDGGTSAITGENTGMPSFNPSTTTYRISDIALIGDQIILPNEVANDVIDQATSGQFSVHTNSIRTYNVAMAQGQETQTVILPIKVCQAKRLLIVFQNNQQRSGQYGVYHDSNCGYNPYALVTSSTGSKNCSSLGYVSGAAVLAPIYGVGFDLPLTYKPTNSGTSALSQQLRIGNEFFPPQPLTSMTEVVAELVKALGGWTNTKYSPQVYGKLVTSINTNASGSIGLPGLYSSEQSLLSYDCLEPSKYVTAFVDANLLDDQTITGNLHMAPLFSNYADRFANQPANEAGGVGNGFNYLAPSGYCLQNMFTVPSGRFIMGFNLSNFKTSDGVDGGTYLGNSTITLNLQQAVAFTSGSWRAVVIVPHRVMMRYEPGGQMIWNY